MSSNDRTIWLVVIPTVGLVLAAWLISRWEPLSGSTVIIEGNKAIEVRQR